MNEKRKLKKLIFIICLLISSFLFAQKPKVKNEPTHDDKPLHFGFSIGINTMDFKTRLSDFAVDNGITADVVTLQPGFHVHAISNLRLAKYLDVRLTPGISFGGVRQIAYISDGYPLDTTELPVNIESNFIEIPVIFKYRASRINNFSPFIIGGINTRFDLASAKKTWGEKDKDSNLLLLNMLDFYYEIGVGFDFYLTYFKLSLELKYSVGILDVLKRKINKKGEVQVPSPEVELYTNVIDQLNSRIFMISFHFE